MNKQWRLAGFREGQVEFKSTCPQGMSISVMLSRPDMYTHALQDKSQVSVFMSHLHRSWSSPWLRRWMHINCWAFSSHPISALLKKLRSLSIITWHKVSHIDCQLVPFNEKGLSVSEVYCIHATGCSPHISAQPPVYPKGRCQIWRNSMGIMSQYFAHPPVWPRPGQKRTVRLCASIQYYRPSQNQYPLLHHQQNCAVLL